MMDPTLGTVGACSTHADTTSECRTVSVVPGDVLPARVTHLGYMARAAAQRRGTHLIAR